MTYCDKHNLLFFTDSGPFGETSYENSKGSLFAIDLTENILKPVSINCLAYPTGLALNQNQSILYVCETAKNRILKIVFNDNGKFHTTVFK